MDNHLARGSSVFPESRHAFFFFVSTDKSHYDDIDDSMTNPISICLLTVSYTAEVAVVKMVKEWSRG